ncbi:MAG: hypothetical protein JJU20_11980 [Opitutales bacterium]|nr:hypothetical protein [Opitutales bacterium]
MNKYLYGGILGSVAASFGWLAYFILEQFSFSEMVSISAGIVLGGLIFTGFIWKERTPVQ